MFAPHGILSEHIVYLPVHWMTDDDFSQMTTVHRYTPKPLTEIGGFATCPTYSVWEPRHKNCTRLPSHRFNTLLLIMHTCRGQGTKPSVSPRRVRSAKASTDSRRPGESPKVLCGFKVAFSLKSKRFFVQAREPGAGHYGTLRVLSTWTHLGGKRCQNGGLKLSGTIGCH